MSRILAAVLLPLLGACGVPETTPLAELEPEQKARICKDELDAFVDEEVLCGDVAYPTTTYESVDACVHAFEVSEDCPATLSDWRACNEALTGEAQCAVLSDFTLPEACDWYADCLVLGR